MPRLILLLAAVAVIYLLVRRVQALPPHKRRSEYFKLGLGVALFATAILALTGRLLWVGAAITALLVTARQALPLLMRFLRSVVKQRIAFRMLLHMSLAVYTSVMRSERASRGRPSLFFSLLLHMLR